MAKYNGTIQEKAFLALNRDLTVPGKICMMGLRGEVRLAARSKKKYTKKENPRPRKTGQQKQKKGGKTPSLLTRTVLWTLQALNQKNNLTSDAILRLIC